MNSNSELFLKWYKNDGYRQINPYLKYGTIPDGTNEAYLKRFKKALDNVMKTKKEQQINEEIILYRGYKGRIPIDVLFKNGNGTFIEKNFSSTSLIPLIQFGNHQMRFRLPDNIKFYKYPNNTGEREYLLESNIVYELKNISTIKIGSLISNNIKSNSVKNHWDKLSVTNDTDIVIYDCDIKPSITGRIEEHKENLEERLKVLYENIVKANNDHEFFTQELTKWTEISYNKELQQKNSIDYNISIEEVKQTAENNIKLCKEEIEKSQKYIDDTNEEIQKIELKLIELHNSMNKKGGGPLPLRFFDVNADHPSADAGNDLLSASGRLVRPAIGGKHTKRSKHSKQSKRSKRNKRSKRTMKGGFFPSIMEPFVIGCSKYIAPLAGLSAYKLLHNPTKKSSRARK